MRSAIRPRISPQKYFRLPSEHGFEFNWLLKQKRELRPEDIFRKESQWEQIIETRCSRELQESDADGLYDDWGKALPKVVRDSRNWQLTGEGLTIELLASSDGVTAQPEVT